jgi:hypothetical protein
MSKISFIKEKKNFFKDKSKVFKLIFFLTPVLITLGGVFLYLFVFRPSQYMLDKAKIYDYKGKTITEDVHISVDGVKIMNATIEGDLYIEDTVGDGHVEIENVIAKGTTYIYGGGKETVVIIGGRIYEALGEFNGRIYAINWASLDKIVVKSSDLILQTDENSKFNKVELQASEGDIELNGNFGEIKDNTEANLIMKEGSMIEEYIPICMGSGCVRSKKKSTVKVEKEAVVKEATIVEPTTWEGEGKVEKVDIQSEDVKIDVEVGEVINEEEYSVDFGEPAFLTLPRRTKVEDNGNYELSFEVNSAGTIYYIFQPPTEITIATPTVEQVMNGEGNSVCPSGSFNCPPSVVSKKVVEVTDYSEPIIVSGYYGDSEEQRPDFQDGFDPQSTLFAVFVNSKGEKSEVVRVEF